MDNEVTNFKTLPDELVHAIFEYLDYGELARVAVTCSWGYERATPLLWKDLELKDKWTLHPKEERAQIAAHRCKDNRCDEHDDTPIIKKLLVLASKPAIASLVQTVLHRCHLPPPSIYHDLPKFSFKSMVLSPDSRTRNLLILAIWNMQNVHTLRIVYGHYNLTHTLIWGFLHPDRPRQIPLRRLWLESCSLALPSPKRMGDSYWPDLTGIESLRIRRLTFLNDKTRALLYRGIAPSRGKACSTLQDGVGGEYRTYTSPVLKNGDVSLETMEDAWFYDSIAYRELPQAHKVLKDGETLLNGTGMLTGQEPAPPVTFLRYLLWDTTPTLTSLNLDMLLTFSCYQERDESDVHDLLNTLSTLRFPHLRAFQMRNANTPWSSLPKGTYLLDAREFAADFRTLSTSFLDFMEAHPKLQCLAWPMDRFFSQHSQSPQIVERRERIMANLGRTLVELRIDISCSEDAMEEGMAPFQSAFGSIARRRRFISWFAPQMKKLEVVKIEGAIPRAERREMIRALYACPLKKIVMIGTSFPLGNNWMNDDRLSNPLGGFGGMNDFEVWGLHHEDEKALALTANNPPPPLSPGFKFEPDFDWPAPCSMANEMASFHAQTITELKFCGFTGAPILYTPTPLAETLLKPLRHFHALERLTVAMWLDTNFEGRYRDEEVVSYWLDARSPYSTALAIVPSSDATADDDDAGDARREDDEGVATNPDDQHNTNDADADPNVHHAFPPTPPYPNHTLASVTVDPLTGPEPVIAIPAAAASSSPSKPSLATWPNRLAALYHPRSIAAQVVRQLGPSLSNEAKSRPGGVLVRASFCLGAQIGCGAVWDVDVRVGRARRRRATKGMRGADDGAETAANGEEGSGGYGNEEKNTAQAKQDEEGVDVLLDFEGPREEAEPARWWGKMRERRWF
ncbi:hypothetical protein IWZ00DRAFT_556883 [Phyllosticta capitalensis]